MGGEMRREKSLRNGVHHADAVVWEPVYRTHLHDVLLFGLRGEEGGVHGRAGVAAGVVRLLFLLFLAILLRREGGRERERERASGRSIRLD